MSSMKIDHDAIKNLAGLLNETGLTEIEVADGDKRIRVTKSATMQAFTTAPQVSAAPVAAPGAVITALSADNHPNALKSPMVGTAYLQAEPGSPRFAAKGDTVKEGDTLLIIEAMKVMNPIKADRSGTVVDILIGDAQPVEFGQALMIIE